MASPEHGPAPAGPVDGSPAPVETEAKFQVSADFVLPTLDGVVEGLVCHLLDRQVLDAHYFDTEALVLLAQGITLRHRAEPKGCRWTVKLPAEGAAHGLLARREIELDSELTQPTPGDIPGEVLESIEPFVGSDAPLVFVARLRTARRRHRMTLGPDPVAELAEDAVEVLDGSGTVIDRFREIEVELSPATPVVGGRLAEMMAALAAVLGAAGAGPADPTPKLVRALGDRARSVAAPDAEPGPSR